MTKEEQLELLNKKVDNLQATLLWMIKGMNNAQSIRNSPKKINSLLSELPYPKDLEDSLNIDS
ncbi:MAG: hypothetical protein IT232_06110 [Flavobacteriales bacterium]|nr:hypothetical protein [Flavobacteriales bacterium]